MNKPNALELLAPAKNAETGIIAINYGADAVYIGAEQFGARYKAGNSIEEIERLIKYAHLYKAKVYITLNTLLFDDEIEQAIEIAHKVYEAGADALIIQDMGLLEAGLPPLPLFASTQTHNYSLERIQFLEAVGFSRIILARELTLDEIEHIHNNTHGVELEFFVHGALCTALSGQCYLSSATSNRSGNRGDCAQLCRLSYNLIDANGNPIKTNKHLLSLKDLNLSEQLGKLVAAGITSFKIEGRLKDTDYIQNIVSHYRKRLDEVIENTTYSKASSGSTQLQFTPNPQFSFSRGFTSHFVEGRQPSQSSMHTPKSIGEPLGKVKSTGGHYFTLESSHQLHNGDGITFLDIDGLFWGTSINKVEDDCIFPNSMQGISKGCLVSRNYHKEFQHTLSKDNSQRLISVSIEMQDTENGFMLKAIDEDGIESLFEHQAEKVAAQQAEKAMATIENQLSKSGNTNYRVTEVKLHLGSAFFIQVSALNEMRRQLLIIHQNTRLAAYQRKLKPLQPNDVPYPETKLSFRANVINHHADAFYKRHGILSIERGFELNDAPESDIIFTSRYCLKFELGECPKQDSASKQYPEPWKLLDNKHEYPISFDCAKCIMHLHQPE